MPQLVDVEFVIKPVEKDETTRIHHLGRLLELASEEGFRRAKKEDLKSSFVFINEDEGLRMAIYRDGADIDGADDLVAGKLNPLYEGIVTNQLTIGYVTNAMERLKEAGYSLKAVKETEKDSY